MIGIIFDMDDTLVATASLWRQAETHLLTQLGSAWSEELALQYKGMNAYDVAATIHRILKPGVSVESCQNILRDALIGAFAANPPAAMPGAVECVRRLARTAPLALASGSPLCVIESVLDRLDLRSQFKCLVSSESVPKGKPAPDVFLAAADALGIAPNLCLVFEDSLIGVRAAGAANMACFAVPSSHPDEIARVADRVLHSLADASGDLVEAAITARQAPKGSESCL